MSNSRIFSIAMSTWFFIVSVLSMFGVRPEAVGLERMVGVFGIGAFWGVGAIAFWGDQATGEKR